MENVIDFLRVALPWIAIGLFPAVFFARSTANLKVPDAKGHLHQGGIDRRPVDKRNVY